MEVRWVVEARFRRTLWEVIVESDHELRLLVGREGVPTRGGMIVQEPYLEITFLRGRPLAAYYYLPRRHSQRSHETVRGATGILVDYNRDGQPIGLEITAPGKVTLSALNRVLRKLGFPAVERSEVAPLIAA